LTAERSDPTALAPVSWRGGDLPEKRFVRCWAPAEKGISLPIDSG